MSLIQELKRRNVIRVGVLLLVIAIAGLVADRLISDSSVDTESAAEDTFAPPEKSIGGAVAITSVRILDVEAGRIVPDQTVVVADGLIVSVGAAGETQIPEGARRIEGNDRVLAPGLADMHAHLGFNYDTDLPISEHELAVYLAHGVTSILSQGDFGSPIGARINGLAQDVDDGVLDGAALYTAAYVRGPNDGRDFQEVETEADGHAVVAASQAAGYDFIKVYHTVPEPAFRGVVAEARARGMGIIAHPILGLTLAENLEIGIDLIAHSESYTYSQFNNEIVPEQLSDAVDVTREYQPWIATTLLLEDLVLAIATGGDEAIETFMARPETRFVHPLVQEGWRERHFTRWQDPNRSEEHYRDTAQFIIEIFQALYASDARYLLGTDGPIVASVPGINVHQEMTYLTKLGASPRDVIRMATLNPGMFLAEHGVIDNPQGQVTVGSQADLVLLHGNPLDALEHYQAIDFVFSDGRVYDRVALDALLDAAAAANASK